MKTSMLMLALLLPMLSCTTLTPDSNPAGEPNEFFVSAGHPWSGQKLLRWESDRLVMRKSGTESKSDKMKEKTFRPSQAQWREFWHKMDELSIWTWRSNYEPDEASGRPIETEAPVWKVSMAVGDGREVDSLGKEVFPPDEKLIWQSEGYRKLCTAIKSLINDEFCD